MCVCLNEYVTYPYARKKRVKYAWVFAGRILLICAFSFIIMYLQDTILFFRAPNPNFAWQLYDAYLKLLLFHFDSIGDGMRQTESVLTLDDPNHPQALLTPESSMFGLCDHSRIQLDSGSLQVRAQTQFSHTEGLLWLSWTWARFVQTQAGYVGCECSSVRCGRGLVKLDSVRFGLGQMDPLALLVWSLTVP